MARIVSGGNTRLIRHGVVNKCLRIRPIFIFLPPSRSAAATKTTASTTESAASKAATSTGPAPATVPTEQGKDKNKEARNQRHHQ
jgi:hypothetical protein